MFNTQAPASTRLGQELNYETAVEEAQSFYTEHERLREDFEERYGGKENPEIYWGYETRKTELEQTRTKLEQMLGYMNTHYSDMTVEPLFTLSGPVEDPEPYQQQVSAMMSAMEDYIESTNGLPDPTELSDTARATSEAVDHASQTKIWTQGEDVDNIGIESVDDLDTQKLMQFSSQELLQNHFEKHREEFGAISVEEYIKRANALAREVESDDVVLLLRSDGSVSKYRFSTNEFVVTNSDGTLRTYFKPEPGKEYWQRELDRN